MKIGDRVRYWDDCTKGIGRIIGVPDIEERRSFDWTVQSEEAAAEFFYEKVGGYDGKKVRHFTSRALTVIEEEKEKVEMYLVLYRGEYLVSCECDSKEEAEELIKNVLDEGTIALEDIKVYKAERVSLSVSIES